jgi:nicotinamidase-related amidase
MANSALLVMDVQNAIVSRIDGDTFLPVVTRAIGAARSADVPVIYVRVAFRPGFPEVSANNKTFSALTDGPAGAAYTLDADETQIHSAVTPLPGDTVVVKKRHSAFTGSGLEVILRGLDVDTLVLSGISTSGVVLSTLRQAADLDFGLTVLSDAVTDADPEVHRVLTEKVFPRQAAVVTTDDWARGL